jgi:predicted permease
VRGEIIINAPLSSLNSKPKTKIMYISSIIGYLMWPVIILISYWMVRWALRKFDKKVAEEKES